jgi:hypothetical protein
MDRGLRPAAEALVPEAQWKLLRLRVVVVVRSELAKPWVVGWLRRRPPAGSSELGEAALAGSCSGAAAFVFFPWTLT